MELFCKLGMLEHVLVLAVYGYEELRAREREHHFKLFLAGMTGYMNVIHCLIDYIRAGFHKLVDHASHQLFVAGDRVCGDDDEILRGYGDLAVFVVRHSRKRGHRLALASGGDDDKLVGRYLSDLLDVNENALWQAYIVQLDSRVQHVYHASAGDCDFASGHLGIVDYLLYAVDIAGEGSDDYALSLGI